MNCRNKLIVGISPAPGVGITAVSASLQHLPDMIQQVIGSSPILVSFLMAFVLNIVTPESPKEEGEEVYFSSLFSASRRGNPPAGGDGNVLL